MNDEESEIDQRSLDERERRLLEAVVFLAKSLKEERDRLAARLAEVEDHLERLAERLSPPRCLHEFHQDGERVG